MDLSLDGDWSLGETKYQAMRSDIEGCLESGFVLEFGSGRSTARLAMDFPSAQIVSVESEHEFLAATKKLVVESGADNVVLVHAPVRWIRVGIRIFRTYGLAERIINSIPEDLDFVLVDGPVESKTLRGREGALYEVFPKIRMGGLIALDDFHRGTAKIMLGNWLSTYRDALEHVRVIEDDLVVVRKVRDVPGLGHPGFSCIADNWVSAVRVLLRIIKIRAKRL